jgi:hypothetical protein
MFSAITNIYNKKTKGPTLMELFTATGKLKFLGGKLTNVYNKKTKWPTLMELFTATGKLKKFFVWQLEMFDVCTAGDTAHIDTIFKLLSRTLTLTFGFLVINVCNHGEHYETPCINDYKQWKWH